MVSPKEPDDTEDDTELDNAWEDYDGDDDREEKLDGEEEIATADVHDQNVTVQEGVGDINSSTSSDLSDAEIDDVVDDEEDDVEVETADLEEEDVKSESGKFGFDETEDADVDDGGGGDGEDDGALGGLDDLDKGGQIAADINNGVASLGVIGIEDDEKQEELREDFFETARDFRLGYYGEECVNEYFLSEDDGDISPVWGLVFASLVCAAVFALKRPDTEELGDKVSGAIGNIGAGLGGDE